MRDASVQPAVTALMPVRAYHENFLRQAITSLHEQTLPHWRLLVIPDARNAADFTARHAKLFADPRIRVVASERGKLACKLNMGMRSAETAFVASLFADDLWSPDAVEVLTRNIAERPDADFFHSSRRFIDAEGRPISSVHRAIPVVSADDFLMRSPVKHLLCWRVATALSFGGIDESLDSVGPDDWDFPWVMAEHGATFVAVKECLYIFRDHRETFRLTTHLPRSTHVRGIRRIMRKHGATRAEIKQRLDAGRSSYLQQCLYATRFDRWIKRLLGADPRKGWHEPYV